MANPSQILNICPTTSENVFAQISSVTAELSQDKYIIEISNIAEIILHARIWDCQ